MKRTFKHAALGLLACLVVVLGIVGVRAVSQSSRQVEVPMAPALALGDAPEKRLAEAVRLKTVSDADPSAMDLEPFRALNARFEQWYPAVHKAVSRETVEPCSLIYRWGPTQGAPVVLMSHTDVVPVEPEKLKEWTHDPFGGAIADGFVWGRGTLDDKVGVLGILEAAELLASQGFKPAKPIWFVFGCDEEVGGHDGASKIVAALKAQNVKPAWVLDEGHIIADGFFPGVAKPIAFIGLAEKGFLTLELTVEGEGGHSSMPPQHTAVGRMARALTRLEANPMPAAISPPVAAMFDHLAPETSYPNRAVFSNLWLFEPVVLRILGSKLSTNATIRTTTAVTVMHGGVRENVLPKSASAKVNFRIAPGQTMDDVVAHATRVIDDPQIQIAKPSKGFNSDPTPVSPVDGPGYVAVRDAVRAVWGSDVLVAPSLTVGGTDGRHMVELGADVYRFLPLELTPADTPRIHGVDERVSVENYHRVIAFYVALMRHVGG